MFAPYGQPSESWYASPLSLHGQAEAHHQYLAPHLSNGFQAATGNSLQPNAFNLQSACGLAQFPASELHPYGPQFYGSGIPPCMPPYLPYGLTSANSLFAPELQHSTDPHELSDAKKKIRRGRRKRKNKPRMNRRLKVKPLLHDESDLHTCPLISGGVPGPLAVSQANLGWQPVLHDERRRSFVSIRKAAFEPDVLSRWWQLCHDELPWYRPLKGERELARNAAWLTTGGCKCSYEYSGIHWPPAEMPDWLQEVTNEVCRACGIIEPPNACNANHYDHGQEFVGWHRDDEPLLDAVRRDALIISLSLGAARYFELCAMDDLEYSYKVLLENGDICTMEGLCQKHFRHCISRDSEVTEPRINLTWRWVVRHEQSCPLSVYNPPDCSADEEVSEGAEVEDDVDSDFCEKQMDLGALVVGMQPRPTVVYQ